MRPFGSTFVGAVLVVTIVACGGSSSSSGPGAPTGGGATPDGPGASASAASNDQSAAPGGIASLLSAADLAGVLGEPLPEPQCGDTALTSTSTCRWTASDGTILQIEKGTGFATVDAWREAFTKAGVTDELPGIGVAALAGDNPFGGVRVTAYTADGESYTLVITKAGDRGALITQAAGLLTIILASA